MNKEEYKMELIRQFRTPNSAERILAMHMSMFERIGQSIYLPYTEFIIIQYGLLVRVDKLPEKRKTVFSIRFEENVDPDVWTESNTIEYLAERTRFVCESMLFSANHMIFYLNSFDLHLDDNKLPTKANVRRGYELVFDINTMRFDEVNLVESMLDEWSWKRTPEKDGYIDLEYDDAIENSLVDFFDANRVDMTLRSEILDVFQNVEHRHEVSTMTQIVRGLKAFWNKQPR